MTDRGAGNQLATVFDTKQSDYFHGFRRSNRPLPGALCQRAIQATATFQFVFEARNQSFTTSGYRADTFHRGVGAGPGVELDRLGWNRIQEPPVLGGYGGGLPTPSALDTPSTASGEISRRCRGSAVTVLT